MEQAFIDTLKKIVDKHGKEYFLDFKKCKAILSDYAGSEYNNVRGLLLRAVEAGASNAIFSVEKEDIERCCKTQHRALHEEQFMDSAAAWNVVNVLAFILREVPIKELQAEQEPVKDSKSGGGSTYDDAVNFYNDEQYDKALPIFKTLAKENHAGAQDYLGECYYQGRGTERDYDEALLWYRRAANQGYAQAVKNLGTCYLNGNGVTLNYDKAVELFRKAADQGNIGALNGLGYCYGSGKGVPHDYDKALEYFRESADQGNISAQNNIGFFYYDGRGVAKDYDKAIKWFRKATDQGSSAAQFNLGWCYYKGFGVAQDLATAVEWFRKAADQGYANAQKELDKLKSEGKI